MLAASLLAATGAWAQTGRLSPAQLQPDVRLLRSALEQLHPGLYRHVDSIMVARHFAALEAAWAEPRPLATAYRELSVFLAGLRDGHTYPNPLNQNKAVRGLLFGHATSLPLHFRIIDKRLIVTANALPDSNVVPRGAEILSIDRAPVGAILDTLLTATRGDGANDANRLRRLEIDGTESMETFDVLYPLFFSVGESFVVEFRTSDKTPARTATIPAVTADAREEMLAQRRPSANPRWRLDFPDARTARLTLPDFNTWRDPKADWRKWLADAFTTIQQKQCDALVLDLRNCEGGDDAVVTELLRYLAPKPLTVVPDRKLWRTNHFDTSLLPFLDAWNPALKTLTSADFVATPDGAYERLKDRARNTVLVPYPQAFREGRRHVYALCGPRNSSASFQLLRDLQANRLAVLVGQPTGGNRRGTTGGQYFLLRLPNTGLEVDLPLIAYTPLRAQPDEGLEPDELVEITVDAVRNGTDQEMARVNALLRDERTER